MVAFVKVLDEVESFFNMAASHSTAPPHMEAIEPYLPAMAEKAMPTAHVVAAYRSLQHETTPAVRESPPKTESLPELMAAAHQSARSLRGLRRRLAWRLHPDRAPHDSAFTLSDVNAAIDAALKKCLSVNE